VLVQKFFKLIGIKIRQYLIAGYECRHIGLRRELSHFRIRARKSFASMHHEHHSRL